MTDSMCRLLQTVLFAFLALFFLYLLLEKLSNIVWQFPFKSQERRVFDTQAGVTVRNRSHIVVLDKQVFQEWVSYLERGASVFYTYEQLGRELTLLNLLPGDDRSI